MISTTIRCSCCGHEGPREIIGIVNHEHKTDVFTDQGHEPYSGELYFRCPRCKVFISVDPTDALGSKTMKGYPVPLETEVSRRTKLLWPLHVLSKLLHRTVALYSRLI